MTNYITEYSSIVILTEKTGGGHEAVANALLETFQLLGEQEDAENWKNDEKIIVSKYYGFSDAGLLAQALGGLYNFFLKYWPTGERLYFKAVNGLRFDKWRLFVKKASGILDKVMEERNPKVIISVYPLFQEALVAAAKKRNLDIPLITVMTDPFPPFWSAWTCRKMDYYFVPAEETKEEITTDKRRPIKKVQGVKPENVTVAGMCVHPKFFAIQEDIPENSVENIRISLGLQPDKFTLFVNAGWNGNSSYISVVQSLLDSDISEIQVIFLAGRNKPLFNKACEAVLNSNRAVLLPEDSKAPPIPQGKLPVKVRGFSSDVEKLMRASDIMISKTGAATGYEAFTSNLPIIVDALHNLMPQEKGLAKFILEKQVGYFLKNPGDTPEIVKNCLNDEIATIYAEDKDIKKLFSKGHKDSSWEAEYSNWKKNAKYSNWKKNAINMNKTNPAKLIAAQVDNYLRNKSKDKNHNFSVDSSLL